MRYFCCDERRREVIRTRGTLNGLEYLEVIDRDAPSEDLRQRTLVLKFLRPAPSFSADNVRIGGGERIETVDVDWVAAPDNLPPGESPMLADGLAPADEFLLVRTRFYGDFSRYTLQLVAGVSDDSPPAQLDPRLAAVAFSFKVECDSDFDCLPASCPPVFTPSPRINYLAKDYASFRSLMLARMSALLSGWRGENAADLAVVLVELLAYVGDHLSYQQDAVATEAYLGTARRRVSLRRHARLVDYQVHDGCNARLWARVKVAAPAVILPRKSQLLTKVADRPPRIDAADLAALAPDAEVFETTDDAIFYPEHWRMRFYTWGDRGCCLPKGSTRATLEGHFPHLKAGDVLVFAEEVGPRTGSEDDADRSRRCAVRLTHVRLAEDPSGRLFLPQPSDGPVAVTEIEWGAEDALPFPLCLSATRRDRDGAEKLLEDVSAAYGNIVGADHGRTIRGELLGVVPAARLRLPPAPDGSCEPPEPSFVPPRFRPQLEQRPLTQAIAQTPELLFQLPLDAPLRQDLDAGQFSANLRERLLAHDVFFRREPVVIQGGDGFWSIADGEQVFVVRETASSLAVSAQPASAARATAAEPRLAEPAISLESRHGDSIATWTARRDLLSSGPGATEFVAEIEYDGQTSLRFGDDVHGLRPNADTRFRATYRVGNGSSGNIGSDSLAHVVSDDTGILEVSNPLPARGGVDAETAEEIRRDAPEAFRTPQRAVTEDDYAEVTGRLPEVQRAAATFRWTGSWHTVFLTIDRRGGAAVDAAFADSVRAHGERFRMAGYDLEVNAPQFVPLSIALRICVEPEYFRAHVRRALEQVLGNGWLSDGRPALFNPDRFTFGQTVYLSDVLRTAQAVPGVASVVADAFERLHAPDSKPLDDAFIRMGRLEVARLDNDPNFPERGILRLEVAGGK